MTRRIAISQHAVERAMIRWLEPTEQAAYAAIRHVVEHGQPHQELGCTVYHYGSRRVRVTDDTAVTVTLHRHKVVRRLARKARADMRERSKRGHL